MNLNSGEIHRLNMKSFDLNGLTFGVVADALLLGWGVSACTFDHLFNFFNSLACVRAFVRFALVCLNIFLSFIQLL